MLRSLFILAGLVGLTALCAQAKAQEWQGKIGAASVIMELDIDSRSNEVRGRYFYRKYNTDILLVGEKTEDGKLDLTEERHGNQMVLNPQGEGWQGEWQDSAATKKLSVALEPLNASALATVKVKEPQWKSSRYDLAKRAGMHLQAGKKQKFMGYTLEWMEEPSTKTRMFRVRDGFSGEALGRINAVLEEQQWQEIYSHFGCTAANGGYSNQTVTPRFLNARLLSVSIFNDFYCGGAHPDFGDEPLNLDIESGKRLTLEDVLWLGKGRPQWFRNADGDLNDDQREYEREVLAPWLAKTMVRLYPRKIKESKPEAVGECSYADDDVWIYPGWYITPKGVYIGARFPRVARVCDDPAWSILPWRIVNQHPGRLKGKLP